MTHLVSFLIPNFLTILSATAIVGGLYSSLVGIHLLSRKRALLAIPSSEIGKASPGLVEVTGTADGLYTVTAPISGTPCFLYQTTVWQQCKNESRKWKQSAQETQHRRFLINDATGQLLVEPLGADLDLLREFREEYDASLFFSDNEVPPRVRAFLTRHNIVPERRLRIEECLIKPKDTLFAVATFMENPGLQVRPLAQSNLESAANSVASELSEPAPEPQIIRLAVAAAASSSSHMTQQGKITAALTRAGIATQEIWTAASVSEQPAPSAALHQQNKEDTQQLEVKQARTGDAASNQTRQNELAERKEKANAERPNKERPCENAASPLVNFTPPMVLMKGASDSMFVISFRSQKELCNVLTRKSAAMLCGGAAITLLGVVTLLAHLAII